MVIKSINGTDVFSSKMSHEAVLALMKKVTEVRLLLGPPQVKKAEVISVSLKRPRPGASFGCEFGSKGGVNVVTAVDGDAVSKVKVGDVLVKINGRRANGNIEMLMQGLAASIDISMVIERGSK